MFRLFFARFWKIMFLDLSAEEAAAIGGTASGATGLQEQEHQGDENKQQDRMVFMS